MSLSAERPAAEPPSRARRRDSQAGSASAELVLLTPLLVAVLGCAFFAGRLVLARQAVDDAARTALQSVMTASDGIHAKELATLTVRAVLEPDGGLCSSITTATDTSNFVPGGTVFVTVTCQVPFARLAFAGVPGSITVQATRGGTLEPYREIGP